MTDIEISKRHSDNGDLTVEGTPTNDPVLQEEPVENGKTNGTSLRHVTININDGQSAASKQERAAAEEVSEDTVQPIEADEVVEVTRLRQKKVVSWWQKFKRRTTNSTYIYRALTKKQKYKCWIRFLVLLVSLLCIAVIVLGFFVNKYRSESYELRQQVYSHQEREKCTDDQIDMWDLSGRLMANITLECPLKYINTNQHCRVVRQVICPSDQVSSDDA